MVIGYYSAYYRLIDYYLLFYVHSETLKRALVWLRSQL